MALVSIGTFLLSKEYFVIEHDFYVGLALAAVLTGVELGILSSQCWGSGSGTGSGSACFGACRIRIH
jgi:hypothetical protein